MECENRDTSHHSPLFTGSQNNWHIGKFIGTNDVRLRQSEISKNNVKEVCELANMMSDTVICSGPLTAYRGKEIHSRLLSLNGWKSKWFPQNNIGFIDNWTSFWGRPDLLKKDSLHPSWGGAALLSTNMAHSLRVRTWLTGAQVRKQTDWLNQLSASRLTSQKSVNSQHIDTLSPRYHTIETVSDPQTRKYKTFPNQSMCNNLNDVQQIKKLYKTEKQTIKLGL